MRRITRNIYKEVAGRLDSKSGESVSCEDWDKDAEFVHQTPNGTNPLGIRKDSKIPAGIDP